MLKICMKEIKKYYGTRLVLDIEELNIYEGDKIGVVGVNGAGKTTLLEIIDKEIDYDGSLMLVDEPTSNLDIDGIDLITNNFKKYINTFLVVSHDRNFLDTVCNKILEIEDGKFEIYNGNYSKYLKLKNERNARKEFEYEEFIKEKNRLLPNP